MAACNCELVELPDDTKAELFLFLYSVSIRAWFGKLKPPALAYLHFLNPLLITTLNGFFPPL